MESKRILIAGFAGSIGSELFRQLASEHTLYGFDLDETRMFDLLEELRLKGYKVSGRVGSVEDTQLIEEVFSDFKPEIVINCAARKHVSPMEDTPMEAIRTNILGTYNLIRASTNNKAWFVNISTDKVVNAENIMGLTKKIAEKMVKNAGFVSVRFGNVLGSRGSVIPFWQGQMDRGEPLTVTDERMERYMMTIPQACELVIEAAKIGKPGEILIIDMGEPVNVLGLAKKIIQESGKDLGIKMIGIRPGETLGERLMTEEESKTAIKSGKFTIIK